MSAKLHLQFMGESPLVDRRQNSPPCPPNPIGPVVIVDRARRGRSDRGHRAVGRAGVSRGADRAWSTSGSTDDTAAARRRGRRGARARRARTAARARSTTTAARARAGRRRAPASGIVRASATATWVRRPARLGPLVEAVESGRCDLAVAAFARKQGGGFGIAVGFARWAIRVAHRTSRLRAPISGQRAMRGATLRRLLPFATGFGDGDRR